MYLVCGEALFDFFLSGSDGNKSVHFEARAGGSPFNVALGIVRQGGRAGLLTGISTDMLGSRLLSMLRDERVETRYLVRTHRSTTLSMVDLDGPEAPQYAFYGEGTADCSLTPRDMPVLGDEVAGLHFGSYSIAVDPVADAFAALAHRERHRFISLDPNVRPTVVGDRDIWHRRIEALLPVVDLVKVSTEDLAFLFPGAEPGSIATSWLDRGPAMIVVTDGPKPAVAYRLSRSVEASPPEMEIVDTVGAGDAFQASLLSQIAERTPSRQAILDMSDADVGILVRNASHLAALTCARRGADIPRLET